MPLRRLRVDRLQHPYLCHSPLYIIRCTCYLRSSAFAYIKENGDITSESSRNVKSPDVDNLDVNHLIWNKAKAGVTEQARKETYSYILLVSTVWVVLMNDMYLTDKGEGQSALCVRSWWLRSKKYKTELIYLNIFIHKQKLKLWEKSIWVTCCSQSFVSWQWVQ